MKALGIQLKTPDNVDMFTIFAINTIICIICYNLVKANIINPENILSIICGFLSGSICSALGVNFKSHGAKGIVFFVLMSVSMLAVAHLIKLM